MSTTNWSQSAGMTSETETDNISGFAEDAEASAVAAAASEAAAAASKLAAASSVTQSASSASAAASSASAAALSETAAETAETNAETAETNAETAETNASASATTATTQAGISTTKAGEASTSASNAASSASSAQASKDAALAALDSFDDRYLGQKASDPTVDNDGDALVAGALYFDTTNDIMKVYDGSQWLAAYASLSGAALQANNLSDLSDIPTARTNLGLGTAATSAATDFVAVTGDSMTGNLNFGDNDKAIFGAGSDLQIYHDGFTSIITETGSGDLRLQGANIDFKDPSGQTYAYFNDTSGAASLYHNNSPKIATTSTGVDITGTLTSDGLTVDGLAEVRSVTNATMSITNTDNTVIDTQVYGTLDFVSEDGSLEGGAKSVTKIQAVNRGGSGSYSALDFYTSGGTGVSTTVPRMRLDYNGDVSFYEDTGTTPKFFWDASAESLGIGTSSPSEKLELIHNGANRARVSVSDTGCNLQFWNDNTATFAAAIGTGNPTSTLSGTTGLKFDTYNGSSWSEAMRIDSSGVVHVGGTSESGTSQVSLNGSGYIKARKDGVSGIFDRITSDGAILGLRKDGATVGSIGATNNNVFLNASGGNYGILQVNGNNRYVWYEAAFYPENDNVRDLGTPNNRFDDVYATNGTIQTSDRNEKQDIEVLTAAETAVAVACKGLLRKFRWIDSVTEKGDDARIHFGIIAQDLQDAFTAEGLDAGRYAMFTSGTWWETQTDVPAVVAVDEVLDEDGSVVTEAVEAKDAYTRTDTFDTLAEAPEGATERTRLGVRYPELLAFIIAAI